MDTKLTKDLEEQGLIRELIRLVNAERKKQGLTINDLVKFYYKTNDQNLETIFRDYEEKIKESTKSKKLIKEDADHEKWVKLNISKKELSIRLVAPGAPD